MHCSTATVILHRMKLQVATHARLLIVGLAALCVLPTEGHVSQLAYMPGGPGLERTIPFVQHAVKATPLNKTEIFKEVTFPAETSFQHTEDKYQEFVTLYKVDEVIGSADIKPGDTIRVWEAPGYGLDLIKLYHETGQNESPIVQRYTALNEAEGKGEVILLLGEKHTEKTVAYELRGTEGLASEGAVRKALAERTTVWKNGRWETVHPGQ